MRRASITLILLFTAAGTFAQSAYTPEKGSTERKTILDALRGPLERDLKQKIVFVTENFKVQGNWAYVDGVPQGAAGKDLDYSRTRYADQVESGAFDHNFFALLKKTGGKWKITTYAIGCTDVCYLDWWRLHKAPKAIFPHTE